MAKKVRETVSINPVNSIEIVTKDFTLKKPKKAKKFDFDKAKGINLDVGCGENKQSNYVGLDIRPLKGVDIVWDLEQCPYPLPDECCNSIIASHVVEHINPARFGFVNCMNEWWRIMKPHGRLAIAMPYGYSNGFLQDPTHCNPRNEATWAYFDPTHASRLWFVYQPRPWKILINSWHIDGTMEVLLEKMPAEDVVVNDKQVVIDRKWIGVNTQIRNS